MKRTILLCVAAFLFAAPAVHAVDPGGGPGHPTFDPQAAFTHLPNPTGIFGYVALQDPATGQPTLSKDPSHEIVAVGLTLHFKSITGQTTQISLALVDQVASMTGPNLPTAIQGVVRNEAELVGGNTLKEADGIRYTFGFQHNDLQNVLPAMTDAATGSGSAGQLVQFNPDFWRLSNLSASAMLHTPVGDYPVTLNEKIDRWPFE